MRGSGVTPRARTSAKMLQAQGALTMRETSILLQAGRAAFFMSYRIKTHGNIGAEFRPSLLAARTVRMAAMMRRCEPATGPLLRHA